MAGITIGAIVKSHFAGSIAVLAALAAGRANADLGMLVPAYFYPILGSPWPQLNAAAGRIPLIAIANPGSGPGTAVDANYTAVIDSLRASGGRVIGYVYSSYATRPLSQVIADIDLWTQFYAIDGIFVDEMSNIADAAALDYYAAVFAYVKSINANWLVVGNPGTNTDEAFLTRPTADILVVVENFSPIYDAYQYSSWNDSHAAGHFSHLVYGQDSPSGMASQSREARDRNAGWMFVTDDNLPNPWDRLPPYWDLEVCVFEAANHGDLNADRQVDLGDLTVLLSHFGEVAFPSQGDIDNSSVVDLADLAFLLGNFGWSCQ